MRSNSLFLGCVLLLTVLVGCSRDDGVPVDESIAVNIPNLYARFLNPVASLPTGDYTVVAATFTAGEAGDFELTITFDDGEVQVFSGSWTSSGGMDPASLGNVAFNFTQNVPGGIDITLTSDNVDTYLYLLDGSGGLFRGDSENNDISVSNTNSQITLQASRIDSEAYGAAYYAAIDPMGIKTTLQSFKDANGYAAADAAGRVIEPMFRDTKDLGYGRGLSAWTQPDGSAYFFVENFQVRTIPGLEYSTLNLDALLEDQRQHHFGTNAIEYSTYPYGVGEPCGPVMGDPSCKTGNMTPPKFVKFFTFDATQGSQIQPDHANETRLDAVDLDGRGDRAMPGACVYCHGGTLHPLRADGSFRDNVYNGSTGNDINGDTDSRLQLLEASSFEYGDQSPFTQAEQEPIIKEMNKIVYCTYPGANSSACAEYCEDPNDTANCGGAGIDVSVVVDNVGGPLSDGQWNGEFAVQMAEGWYDDPTIGSGIADFDSDTFRQEFVPLGWQPDPSDGNPPPGSDLLFTEVVQPVCFVCHSRRGTNFGTDRVLGDSKDIDFSTYDKFISHADLIEEYVYERGVMPLSLRGYNAFWAGDDPEVLASFLPNFSHANADGSIDQPGAPSADAGPDRSAPSPVRMLGSNSRFVSSYSWSIVSTPMGGEDAVLSEATTSNPILTATVDGDYEISLTATGINSTTDQDAVNIKIDNTPVIDPDDLIFMDAGGTCMDMAVEICSVFAEKAVIDGSACDDCHADAILHPSAIEPKPGVPVFWREIQPVTGTTWYQEVLSRVNFGDPQQSFILTKPSGEHHFGGLRDGFEVDNPANRQHYDKMLNWIMAGAREN